MDKYYLVNPNYKEGVFKKPNYYKYSEIPFKGYTIANLIADDILINIVISEFAPICALVVDDENKIVLFKGTEKIVPKNQSEILNYISGKSDYIEQDGVILQILSDIKFSVKDFMYAVRCMY